MNQHEIREQTEHLEYNVKMVIRRYLAQEDSLANLYNTYSLTESQVTEVEDFLWKTKNYE